MYPSHKFTVNYPWLFYYTLQRKLFAFMVLKNPLSQKVTVKGSVTPIFNTTN